jgi:hypothetical protein
MQTHCIKIDSKKLKAICRYFVLKSFLLCRFNPGAHEVHGGLKTDTLEEFDSLVIFINLEEVISKLSSSGRLTEVS